MPQHTHKELSMVVYMYDSAGEWARQAVPRGPNNKLQAQ